MRFSSARRAAAPTRLSSATGTVEMWESAPSFVRRGGRVSFFAGLPGDARVTFLAARLHYDEVRLLAPFHFTPADVARRVRADRRARAAVGAADLARLSARRRSAPPSSDLDAGDGLKVLIEP